MPFYSLLQELAVLANDSDPDALSLPNTLVSNGPASGIANIRNGVVIDYIPNANFDGQDQFSYKITDSGGLQISANVVVSVSGVNVHPLFETIPSQRLKAFLWRLMCWITILILKAILCGNNTKGLNLCVLLLSAFS